MARVVPEAGRGVWTCEALAMGSSVSPAEWHAVVREASDVPVERWEYADDVVYYGPMPGSSRQPQTAGDVKGARSGRDA